MKEEEVAAALEAKRDITQVNEGQLRTVWMTFPAMVARTGTITYNDRFQQLLGELLHISQKIKETGEVLLGPKALIQSVVAKLAPEPLKAPVEHWVKTHKDLFGNHDWDHV